MRIAVIILSLLCALVMVDHSVLPMRLSMLISAGERSPKAIGSLVLFALWTAAAALVYAYPGVACWHFALAGGVGIYTGVTSTVAEFPLWGSVAVMLAVLTRVATREKRVADEVAWARGQHELAVHAALRSLYETVPELFARSAHGDQAANGTTARDGKRPEAVMLRALARSSSAADRRNQPHGSTPDLG
jgi:hypothetical protein